MRKRRGVKIRPVHRMKDSGKWAWCVELIGVEKYLERCADIEVDIEALERLIEPEDEGVCLRYILKYSTRGGSNIFQLFDTSENKGYLVANRRRWLEHRRRERAAMRERWQNEWHDIEYQGAVAKAPPCPERSPRTPLPQQTSSSAGEGGHCVFMEDRRRRSAAFVNVAKEDAKISGNNEELKVGITEL